MAEIHPTAIVAKGAEFAEGVVTPRPETVPVCMVACSRMMLRGPMTRRVGSPL